VLLHERAEHAIGRTAPGNHHPKLLANNLRTGATASGKLAPLHDDRARGNDRPLTFYSDSLRS